MQQVAIYADTLWVWVTLGTSVFSDNSLQRLDKAIVFIWESRLETTVDSSLQESQPEIWTKI